MIEDEMYSKLKSASTINKRQQNININYEKMEKEEIDIVNNQNKILKSTSLIKCLMVLAIKKYTWNNELKLNFGIHGSKIQEFKDLMVELGYLAHKLIWEIPDDVAYFTIKNQANIDHQAQILALTPDGEAWSREAMNYIAKESNKNQSIKFAMNYVLERTDSFKKKYKQIFELEWENEQRYIQHPDGKGGHILELRETLLGKQKRLEFLQTKAQIKILSSKPNVRLQLLEKVGLDPTLLLEDKSQSNQLVLTTGGQLQLTEKQALAIIGEKTPMDELRDAIKHGPKTSYQGKHQHLTENELEQLSSGEIAIDEETGQILRFSKEDLKTGYIGATDPEEMRKLTKMWTGISANGYHRDDLDHQEPKKEKSVFDMLGIEE